MFKKYNKRLQAPKLCKSNNSLNDYIHSLINKFYNHKIRIKEMCPENSNQRKSIRKILQNDSEDVINKLYPAETGFVLIYVFQLLRYLLQHNLDKR